MKTIIFGNRDTAQLAHYYLSIDSEHEVAAFTVNAEYLTDTVFCGLPVVPFEEVEKIYPPSEYAFFAPMTYRKMNNDRKSIYEQAKAKGYSFISYVSSKATVFDNVKIGENCFILEDNTIQPFVKIGNNVVLWSGNHIGHHGTIKDHVFVTSHVVISGNCVIENNCFLGVNATVRDFTHLGEYTFVAMAARITESTEPFSVYSESGSKKLNLSSLRLRV